MQKHTKIYFDYFNIAYDPVTGWHDYIQCEYSGEEAQEIHHIIYKSQGGGDNIENLIALSVKTHALAHAEKITKEQLIEIHRKNL